VDMDVTGDKIRGKIQKAETEKIHTMLIVGGREQESNAVAVRVHGKGDQGVKPRTEVIADILQAIKERRP